MIPLGILAQQAHHVSSSLLTNLVSWWSLDEVSGTRIDAHGSNDLTDNNTVTQATGKVGDAGQFTRTNSEWLSKTAPHGLEGNNRDISVAFWIYLDSIGTSHQIPIAVGGSSGTASTLDYIFQIQTDSFMYFYIGQGGTFKAIKATTFGTLSINTWYFVIGTYDEAANIGSISINDGTVDQTTGITTINNTGNDFYIGRWAHSGGRYVNGRVDEVAFWNKIIDATEITALYNSGSGITYPG